MRKIYKILAISLVFGLLLTPNIQKEVRADQQEYNASEEVEVDFADIYAEVVKGVVMITKYQDSILGESYTTYAIGTAFIFQEDLDYYYFLTNRHVAKDANKLTATFWNHREEEVTLLGMADTMDFAVLRIEKSNTPEVKVLELASTSTFSNPEVGERVYAIGTPYSSALAFSLASGYVAGINRNVSEDAVVLSKQTHGIQIDLTINSGNSGGPLLNSRGQVIGINTLGLVSQTMKVQTLKFALPIHDAYLAAQKIIGSYVHVGSLTQLGTFKPAELSTKNLYRSMLYVDYWKRQELGIPSSQTTGVLIGAQSNDSVLGIATNSIIVGIQGYPIKDVIELRRVLYECEVGEEIELEILEYNDGAYATNTRTIRVTTIEYSE